MRPAELAALIRAETTDLLAARGLAGATLPAKLEGIDWTRQVARPRDPAYGDFATTVALRAAPAVNLPADELATALAERLVTHRAIASAKVAGEGFINLRLTDAARCAVLDQLLAAGPLPEGSEEPMSLTLDPELVERVGADALRYALLRSPRPESAKVDVARLARHTEDNPAYRVRFAHARMAALERQAEALGISRGDHYELLTHPREISLIGVLAEFDAAEYASFARTEAYRVTTYLERLVEALEQFELDCQVLPMGDQPTTDTHRARLALVAAVRLVLAGGLGLLGVSAPERM